LTRHTHIRPLHRTDTLVISAQPKTPFVTTAPASMKPWRPIVALQTAVALIPIDAP
jgi:hypothetical protein